MRARARAGRRVCYARGDGTCTVWCHVRTDLVRAHVSVHGGVQLILIGDSNVGKSALLTRFVDKVFDAESQPTIGVDFKVRVPQLLANVHRVWVDALTPCVLRRACALCAGINDARCLQTLQGYDLGHGRYAAHCRVRAAVQAQGVCIGARAWQWRAVRAACGLTLYGAACNVRVQARSVFARSQVPTTVAHTLSFWYARFSLRFSI
ncbi:hypothetical protein EON67_10855 [archaeon]|nr:MAG: hypothetical protein EON67_10855 [archaeon]